MTSKLVELLKSKNLVIAVAESCTGGAFMASLVKVPGTSEVLHGGVVVYTEVAKVKLLGVERETIEKKTAVSEQVAKEMAAGVRKKLGADVGISVTGYAGPTGDPVGKVCFGVAVSGGEFSVTKNFTGARSEIINARL